MAHPDLPLGSCFEVPYFYQRVRISFPISALEDGSLRQFALEPGAHVPSAALEDLRGGSPEQNAAIARDILDGKRSPRRDIVLLNAAAALCVAGTVDDIDAGVVRAAEAIDSGEARARLARWVAFTGGQGAR